MADIPAFYCSRCGRKLVVKEHQQGFNQLNGKRKLVFESLCPAVLIGWMHGSWDSRIDDNGVVVSRYREGLF